MSNDPGPTYGTEHPHEPDIPPALDADGRCLVCRLELERDRAVAALEAIEDLTHKARARWWV